MIKISNLTKNYGDRVVLKCLNHQFLEKGICVIYGPSGSGKTTLLNCLAGLTSFYGSIQVNRQNIETLNDDDLSQLRLTTYGFVFQDFKLFETETVITNLLFPLETLYSMSKKQKLRKCRDVLEIVGLQGKEKQVVNKLSGGEKQRVAIARALINDPSVILADEPTGALDEQNGNEIMKVLKKISKKALVIIVSHDKALTQKYANQIIEMDEGEIINVSSIMEIGEEKCHLPVLNNGVANSRPKIPDNFLINHTFHTMKQKKLRTILCYTMTSLGLIGVGLAFALSSTIANNIKQAYRDIVDENSMIVSLKNKNSSIQGQYAASFYEVYDIKETYPDYIDDIGATYYCNFESFFPDANALVIVREYHYSHIPGFSVRHINEFEWIEDLKTEIYPQKIEKLKDDEIILALSYSTLRDVCFELQIERTVRSLSNYILDHELKVYFDLKNYAWEYSDQQLFTVKGFTLENDLKIYPNILLFKIPKFQRPFVWSDLFRVKIYGVDTGFRHVILFIAKDDGSDPRDAGDRVVNMLLNVCRETVKIDLHLRPWPDYAHCPVEDVEYLRELVDFCFPQQLPERKDPRIVPCRQTSRPHIGRIQEHGGELDDIETFVFVANPFLQIPDVMLSGAPQDQHAGKQEPGGTEQTEQRDADVEESFKSGINHNDPSCFRPSGVYSM